MTVKNTPKASFARYASAILRKCYYISAYLQPAPCSSVWALFLLSKFPRKAKDHPAAQSTTPISCAELICINVSKGCRSILAGAFIGCAAVKQCWRIGRANARKGREKTNIKSALCSSVLLYLRSVSPWIILPCQISDPKLVDTDRSCFVFFVCVFVVVEDSVSIKRLHSPEVVRGIWQPLHPFIPTRMRENRGARWQCSQLHPGLDLLYQADHPLPGSGCLNGYLRAIQQDFPVS